MPLTLEEKSLFVEATHPVVLNHGSSTIQARRNICFPCSFSPFILLPPRTLCLSADLAIIRFAIFRSARFLGRAFNAEWFFFRTLFRRITRWTCWRTGAFRSFAGTPSWPIRWTLTAVRFTQFHFRILRQILIVLRDT